MNPGVLIPRDSTHAFQSDVNNGNVKITNNGTISVDAEIPDDTEQTVQQAQNLGARDEAVGELKSKDDQDQSINPVTSETSTTDCNKDEIAEENTTHQNDHDDHSILPEEDETETMDDSLESQDGESQLNVNQSNSKSAEVAVAEEVEEQEQEDSDQESEYESDSDSSDEEEEQEEEDPPLLKYTRLSQLPKPFFNKELITTTLIHETFFAFGTSSGILYVTDPTFTHLGTIRARKSPILSISTDGTYIIAASMDGTVAITLISNINNATNTTAYDLKVPLYSVVFKGQYKDSKSFIYATKSGAIVISTLNWLGNRQERTLWKSPSHSPVVRLEIVKNVLVWLGDDGIGFMDLRSEKTLKIIKRPKNSFRAELILPKLNFIEHDRVIIGWVNYIWSIKIEDNIGHNPATTQHETGTINEVQSHNGSAFRFSSPMSTFSRNSQDINISVEYHFKIEDDALIGGIGSFKDDNVLILVLKEENGKLVEAPELRIINYFNKEEIASDEIVLRDYQLLKCNDFSLGQSNHSKVFLIASTDGIIADEYSLRDRFDWYVTNNKLLRAYDTSQYLISKRERATLGIRQVEAYINENTAHNWNNATNFLAKVIDDSFDLESKHNDVCVDLWDQWSWIYIKNKKFTLLADILPRDKVKNVVDKSVYDKILTEFIETRDQLNFHKYLQYWDLSFFNVDEILRKLENLLEFEPDLDIFERCLAECYLKLSQPKNAIRHFILLQDPIVIDLLKKYHLISCFIKDVPTIVKFQISNEELQSSPLSVVSERLHDIIDLLVSSRHELPPQTVVDVLNTPTLDKLKFLYLEKLLHVDPALTQPFETLIFYLYATHNSQNLLSFLKKHRHYNIQEAITTLQNNKQYSELVYLLGRVGQTREAMSLLINEMDDPTEALHFAREENSKDLWDMFIDHGITKPNFIKVIIQYTGILFDTSLLKRIPEGVEIDGLQSSLVRIMTDNFCDLTIQQTILKILEIEGVKYCDLMNQLRLQGRCIAENLDLLRQYSVVSVDDKGIMNGVGDRLV
ncbi:hypothetical protein WICPIJ_004954 [Wickerhamomyces pijperi]|uniref:Vps41 beta-propeller domain-containing protein n=1 Tax=Wickerhamomyces pijperi TaxID=599730 RepID=A0A9P8TME7_WICPI|nr:hypothetical protein WICPIJ_004954 [Wickerhamomyces pijperi]